MITDEQILEWQRKAAEEYARTKNVMSLATVPHARMGGVMVGFCPGCTYWARLHDVEDDAGHCVSSACSACDPPRPRVRVEPIRPIESATARAWRRVFGGPKVRP